LRCGRGSLDGGEGKGDAQQCAAPEASMWPRDDARLVTGRGRSAEGRARRWQSGGGKEVRTGGANGGWRGLVASVRVREERPGRVFIGAGGRLGASEVTMTTRARVERSRDGRRRGPLRRSMVHHGRCAGRWIDATWRGPLATDGTGELPPAQRSDQRSLRRLGVHARCGYGAYGGLPTWPCTTSRLGASRHSRGVCISLKQFSN
jgi:hypothetical protein